LTALLFSSNIGSLELNGEISMPNLSKDDIRAMGKAVGLDINDPELTEVTYSLNALLESLDAINPPGLNDVEPLPIILPPV
jgi:hypothetical protein|tara:strand:- start:439 stop:681 length:243 start_codon:yes stop_codon:yes gene_type:complete